mgnify:CR=1 FL=1
MNWIDTHTHLYLPQFDADREDVFSRLKAEGIDKVFLPNIELDTISSMNSLVEQYPGVAYAMMGLHPCSVKAESLESEMTGLRNELEKNPEHYVAIGEIGIDLYWDKTTLDLQIEAFVQQIRWAKEYKKPIVIHCRESFDEIFYVLDQEAGEDLSGIFHCFTGNHEQAQRVIGYGLHLGVGGVATFKNGGLDQSLCGIDLKHMVLETDSPYLAPVPFRGKRNESAYIPYVGSKLASILGQPIEEVARITTENARAIFGI